jgi:DNA-binding transcriptional LysR family regulator
MNNKKKIMPKWNVLWILKSDYVCKNLLQLQSFTRTAEEMYVTQPTISKAIHHLEQEMGVPLFHKGQAGRKRDVALTYMGDKFINMLW